MNKTFGIVIAVAGIAVIGFFAFNSFIYNEKQIDNPSVELGKYFQEQMFTRGTVDGFIPIEGFDAGLLMGKFSGLVANDFKGVETFEGVYIVKNGEAVFTRTKRQPISSAETTVSEEGYRTLLANLSARLSLSVTAESDVDALIGRLSQTSITNFEECVAAGNAVMESYPEQCIDAAGNHFTQNIGNELEKADLIRLDTPRPNQLVSSPLVIKGEARGNWFFEASFPVILTDWDGRIIAEGFATAEGEWMTTDFVPFTATLAYTLEEGSYSNKGTLILKKDNPSGLSENDDALEIPVVFSEGNN